MPYGTLDELIMSYYCAKLLSYFHFLQIITEHEYPDFVKIVEVGPRDGLQNEKVYFDISMRNLICI